MCVVSMAHDYFRDRTPPWVLPKIQPDTTAPYTAPTIQPIEWTRETFEMAKKILEQLGKLDELLKQPDCEDPSKAAWIQEVERRLQELEKAKPAARRKKWRDLKRKGRKPKRSPK